MFTKAATTEACFWYIVAGVSTYGKVIGKRSNKSGSQAVSSSGTSGDQGDERSMLPAWRMSTATRLPWDTISRRKFIVCDVLLWLELEAISFVRFHEGRKVWKPEIKMHARSR